MAGPLHVPRNTKFYLVLHFLHMDASVSVDGRGCSATGYGFPGLLCRDGLAWPGTPVRATVLLCAEQSAFVVIDTDYCTTIVIALE